LLVAARRAAVAINPNPPGYYVSNYFQWATVPHRTYNSQLDWASYGPPNNATLSPENMAGEAAESFNGGDLPWATLMGTYEVGAGRWVLGVWALALGAGRWVLARAGAQRPAAVGPGVMQQQQAGKFSAAPRLLQAPQRQQLGWWCAVAGTQATPRWRHLSNGLGCAAAPTQPCPAWPCHQQQQQQQQQQQWLKAQERHL
jgi:hypothetical protein